VPDPVLGLSLDAPCWCRSGRSHGSCHGNSRPPSLPGDPVPADDEDSVFLSPSTRVSRDLVDRLVKGTPIYGPSSEPMQAALRVPTVVEAMASRPLRTTVELDQLGVQRFSVLDQLGLSDAKQLEQRVAQLSDAEISDLRYALLDIGKSAFDRLLEESATPEPPTVIWAGSSPPGALLGATLLWADHYLVDDVVLAALSRAERPASLVNDLRDMLELRPLIETGLVVPVSHDAATLIAGERALAETELDLRKSDLVEWVKGQLVAEGPTARDALLFHALDDADDFVEFFLYSRIIHLDEQTRTTTSRLLGPFDPAFDYGPWIAQSRNQAAASIIQETNRQLAMAASFGASWVTLSPFRARLLVQRETPFTGPQALVWADIPHLQRASAIGLAKVASDDAAVRALRERTRQVFASMRGSSLQQRDEQVAEFSRELRYASEKLRREMDRNRRWALAIPAGLSVASLAIGAAEGATAVGAVAVALAAAAGLSPYVAARASAHDNPAYALLLGDSLAGPRESSNLGRGTSLTQVDFPVQILATS
jgi:hypothetical protein